VQNARRNRLVAVMVAASVIILAGAGVPVRAEDAITVDDFTSVRLVLTVDHAGHPFVYVNPARAKLWRDKPGRPWMTRWSAANSSPYSELYWEIRHQPAPDGGSQNYLGDFDIECGQRLLDVKPSVPEVEGASWQFEVAVYSCVDGAKGPLKATFNGKPKIVWKN
jgi:hypothetical protein